MIRFFITCSFFLLSNILYSQQEFAWVYFKDKKNVEYFINNPELILTDISISKKQSKGIPIDYNDVPIDNDYIDILTDIVDLTILATSKWLNCVYVESEIDLLSSLNELNFVDRVEFANKSLKEVAKNTFHSFIATAILVTLGLLAAIAATYFVDTHFLTLLLSFSPGGIYEVAVIAIAFDLDPNFVAFHHIIRLLMILFTIPVILKLIKKTNPKH